MVAEQLESPAGNEASSTGRGPQGICDGDRVVVVLGAGASISEMSAHTQGKGPLPPSDRDFITVASEQCPGHFRSVRTAFADVWGSAPPYKLESKHMRMEQLFASSFMQLRQTNGTTREGRHARELFDLIVVLMRETMVATTDLPSPPQHIELIRRLRECEPQTLDFLCLNYDVLVDRALLAASHADLLRWDYRDGYGFLPDGRSHPTQHSDVSLLKLHGSVNWYIDQQSTNRQTAYDPSAPVHIPQPRYKPDRPAWARRQRVRGHSSQSFFPLLVPPVFEKSTQISGRIADLWAKAGSLLRHASLVIVWGYSMPPTDYHAEILFSQAARSAKYDLIVVNPDRAALAHVNDVCGHAWTRWFFDISDFFEFMDRDWER